MMVKKQNSFFPARSSGLDSMVEDDEPVKVTPFAKKKKKIKKPSVNLEKMTNEQGAY